MLQEPGSWAVLDWTELSLNVALELRTDPCNSGEVGSSCSTGCLELELKISEVNTCDGPSPVSWTLNRDFVSC